MSDLIKNSQMKETVTDPKLIANISSKNNVFKFFPINANKII